MRHPNENDGKDPLVSSFLTSVNAILGGDPKGAAGAEKPQLHLIPPVAMSHLAASLADGAGRYGPWNWRDTRVKASTYISAMMRHTDAFRDGEDMTTDSLVHHPGAVMANCAIMLDAMEHGCLEDDRPKKP